MSHEPPPPGLIETLNTMLGGAATALLAALIGRVMYHALEVRARRRPILSLALLWEPVFAVGMALIGDAVGEYLGLTSTARVGLIAVLSYYGPRGAGAFLDRWVSSRTNGDRS